MIHPLQERAKSFVIFWVLLSYKTKKELLFCLFLAFFQGIYQLFSVLLLLPLISFITTRDTNFSFQFLPDISISPSQAALIFVISVISSFFINYKVTRKTNLIISKCGYELGSKTFEKLISKNYEYFLSNDPSALNSAIAFELAQIIKGLFSPLIIIISSLVISLILLAAVLITSPYFILALIISIVFSIPIFKWNIRLASKNKLKELKIHNQKLFTILGMLINSPEELYFTNIKKHLREKFNTNYFQLRIKDSEIEYTRFFTKYIVDLSLYFILITLFLINYLEIGQFLNISSIGFTLLLFQKLLPYLYQIYVNCLIIRSSRPAFKTIIGIHSNEYLNESYIQKEYTSLNYSNITSRFISSSYRKPININLFPGDRLLLSGPSGSGKSTLLLIMSGLISPEKGAIKLGNNESKLGSNLVSFIPQKSFCFQGSIAFNICLKNNFSDDDLKILKQVFEASCLSKDYKFKELFTKQLNENLSNISGGQLQRIAIARGLFKKPNYLFLDEPTSSLPQSVSITIIKNISNFLPDSIIIYTSHKEYEWVIATKRIDLEV